MEYIDVEEEQVIARAQAVHGGGPPETQDSIVFCNGFEYVVGQRECEGCAVGVIERFPYRQNAGEDEVARTYAFALQAMMRLAMEN